MTRQKIWDIILIVFSVYWTVFFLLDYWDKHPNYSVVIKYFKYTKLALFLVFLGTGLSYLVTKFKKGFISKFYNGISIYILGIIIITAIVISYNKYLNLDIKSNNYLHLYGRLSANFFSGYFIILACYSAGNLILKKLFKDVIKHHHFTYDFGLGAIIITLLLFLIGTVGQLKMFVVLPILLLLILCNYKGALDFLLTTFIKPIKVKTETGFSGYFFLFGLFAFLILNFIAIDLPFPVGFDSRNLYINIANQIGVTNKLVAGYQPYSWSLFLSQGFIIFGRTETTLFLSFVTGVLCLFSTYHLARKYFKISFNNSSLTVLVAGIIPSFANQYFVELKTDFGLMFYQLLAILITMELFLKHDNEIDNFFLGIKKRKLQILCLIGLFLGFGLSIKLLNLFLIYGLVVIIWRMKGNIYGTIGLLLVFFSALIILGLNNISGLGNYHLGNNLAQWLYLTVGIALIIYAYLKNKTYGTLFIKQIFIVGFVSLIPLLPWLGKNYYETRSLSPTQLLMGDSPGPEDVLITIERNFKK